MSRYFIALSFLTVCPDAEISGQQRSPIQTDRPDQTECPVIVPVHHVQIESGYLFEKTKTTEKSVQLPSVLWKYGLHPRWELRLITERTTHHADDVKHAGLNPVEIGFKTSLLAEKGLRPMISLIGHIGLPGLASGYFKTRYPAPSFRFTMQHTVSQKISIGYNLGAEWDGDSPAATFIYTITGGMALAEKTGCYLELYGFLNQTENADHRVDGGFTFFIKPNLMLDISGGAGISRQAPRAYGAIGLSLRLPD